MKTHKKQEKSSKLRMLLYTLFQSLKEVCYTLKKHLCGCSLGFGVAILSLPKNPCPSCETDLELCTTQLYQKGYLLTGYTIPNKKGNCCLMMANAKKQAKQVKPLIC